MSSPTPHRRRRMVGVVRSDKMQKTVTVVVTRRVPDPLYGKYVNLRTSFKAHDPAEECGPGDTVEIEEHRPLASTKRWKVVRIVRRSQ